MISNALPLGPIPLDEGIKLRYPLLQLEREKRGRAHRAAARRVQYRQKEGGDKL